MAEEIRFNSEGLVPCVVQDAHTGRVLMLAYMNEASLSRTLESGQTWFYSRSRQELWHKGATSGHTQRVVELRYDCDSDTLLALVDPSGPACHTGKDSCFFSRVASEADGSETVDPASESFAVLPQLYRLIAERKASPPQDSYTARLFEKGLDTILKKVGEEATETVIAAKGGRRDEVIHEAADLLYHLGVLLAQSDVGFEEVSAQLLARRK